MTARFTGTTSPRSDGHAAEVMRLYQEGIIAGTLGAATIALWFLVLDILAGHPLYTPNVLGIALFKGRGGLVPQAYVEISLVVLGRNNPSPYTVNGRPLYVHLNGLAIV